MHSKYFEGKTPRILGHRGSFGTLPENTLPSFAEAASYVPYLEMDVWGTRDGTIVVHHDPSALRTCGVEKNISDLSFSEVQQLNAGEMFSLDNGNTFPFRQAGFQIPTLIEVLERFPKHFLNIEIKQDEPKIEKLVLEALQNANATERVLLTAEKDPVIKTIRELDQNIATGSSTHEILQFVEWMSKGCPSGYRPAGKAMQIPTQHGPHLLADQRLIDAAHQVGVEVHFWTINTVKEAQELFSLGADGIFTDYPKMMVEALGVRENERLLR